METEIKGTVVTYPSLKKLIQAQPFRPFVVTTSDGREFAIAHTENCLLTKVELIVYSADEELHMLSLLHLVSAKKSATPEHDPSSEAA